MESSRVHHWLVPTTAATGCWALSDVCCDCCISGEEPKAGALSPEQNAVISATVSLCSALALLAYAGTLESRDSAIGLVAGGVHFVAYAIELKAYRTASSTVITPLLQLSAVWMTLLRTGQPLVASALPNADDVEALYVATAAMKPAHLVAVVFIFVGGFLPAARGRLSRFAESAFYRQEAVRCCVFGELLVCVYNALLHMCTFTDSLDLKNSRKDVFRFFAVSRTGTSLACALAVLSGLCGFSRRDVCDLASRRPTYLVGALFGEVLSVLGVGVVMFSYANFREPAVVNAAEGGVQQLLNLCFALSLRYFCGVGRKIEHTKTKLLSFALVSLGLTLSAI